MKIPEIDDPFDRYIAFLIERNEIYKRKQSGEPWPWTEDPILQTYRFTEVYRERDRTSLHYQKTVRNRYAESAEVLPATVFYRWFNRIETNDYFFNQPNFVNVSVFEEYIMSDSITVLQNCLDKIPPPHVTGAFIVTGKPGYPKGEGVLQYIHTWCQKPWESQWNKWKEEIPTLEEVFDWVNSDGLGSFMKAQIVADLKYLPILKNASDWWTWAAPGPGSMKGLNVVNGRGMQNPWNPIEWLEKIQELRVKENVALESYGMGPFHAQDTQNHCCEFSKYTKAMMGTGRPRQVYRR